ncbi:replication protein A 32 kDa subunit [Vairimorpha necatrix]|uniref:Replication protein A 32 kDa subunit n=1 Tax=Vairimorpha necatrix TaxID=6039 RepID=A0AAX4JCC7_9MICR
MSDLGYNPSSPKKEYTGIKTIRSLTIKQLQSAEHEEGSTVMYVDNKELTTFRLIGWTCSVKTTNTGKVFILEDGTSEIECTMWSNKTYEEYLANLIEDGLFIKVTGTLKEYLGKKSVNVTSLYVIEDYNEMLYHMASSVKEHLMKKDVPVTNDLLKIQKDILECIRNNQDDDTGLPINIILKCLQNEYNERMIRENIDFLVDNCHLIMADDGGYKTVN